MGDDRIAAYAALQAAAETGIGSLVHAFHIPLGGHLLSLNQAWVLTCAIRGAEGRRQSVSAACGVSTAAALLKSLSPAGDKLSPMIAITTQGWLYALGPGALGRNPAGAVLGSLLLGFWAFAHPVLKAYLFFGGTFFEAIVKSWVELSRRGGWDSGWGLWLLGAAVLLKLALASGVAILGWKASPTLERRYRSWVRGFRPSGSPSALALEPGLTPAKGALRDLFQPLFLGSLLLSAAFLAFSEEAAVARVVLYICRSLALGFLFFWVVRVFWSRRTLETAKSSGLTAC